MRKLLATLGLLAIAALAGIGIAGPAQADDQADEATGPDGAPASSSATSLLEAGAPRDALLVGGVALLAVGGTALVVSRRGRSDV